MMRDRRGFTMIELVIVMLVLSVLTGIGLLKYIDLKHRALSSQASADLQTVRLAAYSAWYETGVWPADAAPGVVPTGLTAYLPTNFPFVRPDYTLDWENFIPPGGGPSAGPMQLGLVLSSSNPRLTQTLAQMLGNKGPFLIVGGDLTFVIVGPSGQS